MQLPFTPAQFFEVFRQYNEAVWPMQVLLNLLALAALVTLLRPGRGASRVAAFILALLWTWTGVAYHWAFFIAINKAAWGFGAVFLLGATAFLWTGVVKGRLDFGTARGPRGILGWMLIGYALVVYPLLTTWFGHAYPELPTFGLPCPTTIYSIGLLCFLAAPFPRLVLAAPLIWTLVGTQAVFLLGVYADLGLLVAGLVAAYLFFVARPSTVAPG